MNTFEIKAIAVITMIVDHIGLFFFPDQILFRIIGRLSFPLFAWLIANGVHHTRNIKLYVARIFLFAALSQVPFLFANWQIDSSFWYLNILFTLLLGLVAISVMKTTTNKLLWIITATICVLVADVLKTDYGAAGVLSIIAFFLFHKKLKYMVIAQVFVLCIFPLATFLIESYYKLQLSFYYTDSLLEPFGLFSLIFIAMYTGKEGIKIKYFFYHFYPLQYLAILLLKVYS